MSYNILYLLEGLSSVLSTLNHDIYISNRQQEVDTPCFFITMISSGSEVEMGRVYMNELVLDIVFLQDPNIVNAMEGVYAVLQYLDEHLELIPYEDPDLEEEGVVHTYNRTSSIQDFDLHYHVTFKNRVYFAEENEKIKTLEDINVTIKANQS